MCLWFVWLTSMKSARHWTLLQLNYGVWMDTCGIWMQSKFVLCLTEVVFSVERFWKVLQSSVSLVLLNSTVLSLVSFHPFFLPLILCLFSFLLSFFITFFSSFSFSLSLSPFISSLPAFFPSFLPVFYFVFLPFSPYFFVPVCVDIFLLHIWVSLCT
jgi:hypothetical protein